MLAFHLVQIPNSAAFHGDVLQLSFFARTCMVSSDAGLHFELIQAILSVMLPSSTSSIELLCAQTPWPFPWLQ